MSIELTTAVALDGTVLMRPRWRRPRVAHATALRLARQIGQDVRLQDAHGIWRVTPDGGSWLEESSAAPLDEDTP
jgi:hypothetical protein